MTETPSNWTEPQMSPTSSPLDGGTGSSDGTGQSNGVKNEAQAQAQQVAGTAKDEAGAVLDTAKEQAQAVVSDVRGQTKQLTEDARTQLLDHAGSQRDRAVETLRGMSDDFSSMAETSTSSGLATQLAREGGDLAQKVADFLEQREPGQLLDEVRDLARRRPGAFLLGAAFAGLVAGRATRGVVSAHKSSGNGDQSTSMSPTVTDHTATLDPTPAAVVSDSWGPGGTQYPGTAPTGRADAGVRP